jgi:hypothetical protein
LDQNVSNQEVNTAVDRGHGQHDNINAVKSPLWTLYVDGRRRVRYRTDNVNDAANYFGTNISWMNGAARAG